MSNYDAQYSAMCNNNGGIIDDLILYKMPGGYFMVVNAGNIDKNITKGSLTSQLNRIGTSLLNQTLPKFFDKKILLQKQNEDNATYAKKITPDIRKIDFNNDVSIIFNQIRAFSPKPSAWFSFNSHRINLIKCSMKICNASPSKIINDQFHIGCNNGIIIPEIIQRQGKKPMEINEFLRGFTFEVGKKVNA